ncbi:MAG: hypothetical protein OQK46_07440 [Gammaproteobacteria bacterium]|nr:hypothetical protein [Gammaproteobacteria bacterium]
MQISLIYVLIMVEALLVLLGISVTLAIILLRKPKSTDTTNELSNGKVEEELDATGPGNSYIDFLEKAMLRNETKTKQQEAIENEPSDSDGTEEADKNTSPAPNEAQSSLLHAREQFLLMEKAAAEKTEHEIHFWDSIYDGMTHLLEQFSSTNTIQSSSENSTPAEQSKEKVFYIETQGKKIDGEVNKLKDIIYEQENALSSMKKSLEGDEAENPEFLDTLKEQLAALERQLNDSKMCMDVLEMENTRLQEEVNNIDSRHESLFADDENSNAEDNDSFIDLDQMKEVVEQQESRIQNLIDTIEGLEIDAAQAEKLKETIGDFARTSKEMMGCISILEEENERLSASTNETESNDAGEAADNLEIDGLKSTISQLEEEVIKKDVAFAKLQDEFSSMETEYLSMYESVHGDNS